MDPLYLSRIITEDIYINNGLIRDKASEYEEPDYDSGEYDTVED